MKDLQDLDEIEPLQTEPVEEPVESASEEPEVELPSFIIDEINSEDSDWAPDFDILGQNIDSLSTGLELPSEIFSLAVRFFNIKSGIFLTFETSTNMFIPFSSIGVDETSLRRCKIEMDVFEKNNLIFNGKTIHPSFSKDFLKSYLSGRVWDTVQDLDVFVFNHHDRLFGIMLIFNVALHFHKQYIDFSSFFTRKCSEVFFNSRSKVISSLPNAESLPPLAASDAAGAITDSLKTFSNKSIESIKLVIIKYSEIIDFVLNKDKSIDKHRIEYDIFKMYNSMLFDSSFIIRINNSSIILCITDELKDDNKIIKHQMTSSLLSLFKNHQLIKSPDVYISDFESGSDTLTEDISTFLETNL